MAFARKYDDKLREDALAMALARRAADPKDRTIFREVSQHFAVGEQSLRIWVKAHDAAAADDHDTSETVELEDLHREIERLRTENAALKQAFVVFSNEWRQSSF